MKQHTELYTRETIDNHGNNSDSNQPFGGKRVIFTIKGWQRFGHYMIDWAIITGIIVLLTLYTSLNNYFSVDINHQYRLELLGYFVLVFYYFTLESTIGRTIGKFATNSYVIDEKANKPAAGTIFLRSIIRIIPFFALSCLSDRGWHDKWTNTYVVSKKEWDNLKKGYGEDYFSDDLEILDT